MAMHMLETLGERESSRAGDVLVAPWPVATVYERPTERVLFHAWRDANPFFHLYESLWMLSGRNDVAPLTRFVKRMSSFSDDGFTFNAAYGHRWRRHHMGDQLVEIGRRLRNNHQDRRCVLKIWDQEQDLWDFELIQLDEDVITGERSSYVGKDAACNVSATFQVRKGALDMTVLCRSNDILWGCYGANAVHFSMLLEYIAARVGVPVGLYRQISVNWHAYESEWSKVTRRQKDEQNRLKKAVGDDLLMSMDPYSNRACQPYPLVTVVPEFWDEDCRRFVTNDGRAPSGRFKYPFFTDVALPIVQAHDAYKDGDINTAVRILLGCKAADWRIACVEWLNRRMERKTK